MKGFQGKTPYNDYLISVQRKTLERLAEIEREDADRCANCGGEDCICCEYYLDRQKWVGPEELFDEWNQSDIFHGWHDEDDWYDDEEEE